MAQKIQTLFIDDLDGSAAEGTVRFGLDGTEYEIDLNAAHARQLRDALARYVDAARRVSGSARKPARGSRRGPDGDPGYYRCPRMGQGPGHRGERPWPGARGPDGQIQGRYRPAGLTFTSREKCGT
jgi:hypothetical protein